MKYAILLSPEATQDLKLLDAYEKVKIKNSIEIHLRHEPAKISKSRIKRLRGLRHPQFRLLVDDFRAFYDIEEDRVEILAIILKSKAAEWLKKAGESI